VTRWIAAGGAFVVSLDSMVNVAFPAIAAAFGLAPEQVRWIIVCYVLCYALLSLGGGALGDAAGHARVFRAGMAGSAVAFALAGLAPTFGWLLAARALQGLSAGFVYGTAPALVIRGLPDTARTRALGFLNAAMGLAYSVGPAVAGWLVERVGWTATFHVRAPLALAVLVWAWLGADGAAPHAGTRRRGTRVMLGAGVLVPGVLAFVAQGGIFAIWLLAPFYLVERRGLATAVAGLLFTLAPLGTTAGSAAAGWLPGALAGRGAIALGLALEACALFGLGGAGPSTPVPLLALALFGAGLGLGLFQVPNMAALMREFPAAQQGTAGGLAFMARTLGVVAGVLVLARLFAAARLSAGFDAGFLRAFLVAAAAVGIAAAASGVAIVRTARAAVAPGPSDRGA
jgi:MFS family permease